MAHSSVQLTYGYWIAVDMDGYSEYHPHTEGDWGVGIKVYGEWMVFNDEKEAEDYLEHIEYMEYLDEVEE